MKALKRVSAACLLTVAVVFSSAAPAPAVTWGQSYAYSSETASVWQKYYAKAAANVYNNQRIISVCVWFTRSGVQQGQYKCSNATSNARWYAGPEVSDTVADTIAWGQPKNILNIKTSRISPNIY